MQLRFIDEHNDRGHLLWAEEPVGLALRGETQQAALSKLPAELTAYRRWLGLPPVPAVGVVTQEAASPLNIHDADSDILLPSEHRPLTAEEYEARKALALRSAEDFLTLYRSIPDKTHTTLPQRETFYGDVPLTAEEIAAVLEQFKKRVRIVAVVDSLKHLQKGGRLPAAVALVGGALGIKPVLALQDGAIKLVDKGRGRPGALVAMFKQLDALGGVDPRYGYTLLYSDNKQLIAPVHHYMHQNLQLTGGRVAQLGPTIGTHVGPGVVGVVFVAKE